MMHFLLSDRHAHLRAIIAELSPAWNSVAKAKAKTLSGRKLRKEMRHFLDRDPLFQYAQREDHGAHDIHALHARINERGRLQDLLWDATENGKICIVRAGRDCDCVQYVHSHIEPVPTSLVDFLRRQEHHEEGLDGPERTYYVRPSMRPRSYSRDLVMEAYEDGHPHVIYSSFG